MSKGEISPQRFFRKTRISTRNGTEDRRRCCGWMIGSGDGETKNCLFTGRREKIPTSKRRINRFWNRPAFEVGKEKKKKKKCLFSSPCLFVLTFKNVLSFYWLRCTDRNSLKSTECFLRCFHWVSGLLLTSSGEQHLLHRIGERKGPSSDRWNRRHAHWWQPSTSLPRKEVLPRLINWCCREEGKVRESIQFAVHFDGRCCSSLLRGPRVPSVVQQKSELCSE